MRVGELVLILRSAGFFFQKSLITKYSQSGKRQHGTIQNTSGFSILKFQYGELVSRGNTVKKNKKGRRRRAEGRGKKRI